MVNKKNCCKKSYEFFCTDKDGCIFNKNAGMGECDFADEKNRVVCTCIEAILEVLKCADKRKPEINDDGCLMLTEDEIKEYESKFVNKLPNRDDYKFVGVSWCEIGECFYNMHEFNFGKRILSQVTSYKAIAYLLERFDFSNGNKSE